MLSFNILPILFIFAGIAIIPFVFGVLLGSRVFNPERENAYRGVAYFVIGLSAIYGLPFWG
jgi:hypothetical protein